jgi:hypothetical protein
VFEKLTLSRSMLDPYRGTLRQPLAQPILNMLHEHLRKWLARCRNTVATRFSRSDPNDREALSSKTELKWRESRSIQEIKQWARPRIEL